MAAMPNLAITSFIGLLGVMVKLCDATSLAADGFQHISPWCRTSGGTSGGILEHAGTGESWGGWDCVAWDGTQAISMKGTGPRGFSFKAYPDVDVQTQPHLVIGIQWAGTAARIEDPTTYSTSSMSNFKDLWDATKPGGQCAINSGCSRGGANLYGIDAGFTTWRDAQSRHFEQQDGNPPWFSTNGNYGIVFSVLLNDKTRMIEWYADDKLIASEPSIKGNKEGCGGGSCTRAGKSLDDPHWLVASVSGRYKGANFKELKYISAVGVDWLPSTTTETVTATTLTATTLTATSTSSTTALVFIDAAHSGCGGYWAVLMVWILFNFEAGH